ncbi:MAG: glycosyltransferase [Ktedonobacterales bacterium]|nr:glycosyltransferase [Ktedonobacterales bacterium]
MTGQLGMGALYAAASPWGLAGIVGASGAVSLAHYRALPALISGTGETPGESVAWPRVSIVVPARNEAANLPTLLRSLMALDYRDYEIIVVDDDSTDATGQIATDFARESAGRVRVVRGSGPASGWTGKNYACHLGAQAATGAWLLFTDADTEHAPASLRLAMGAALAAGASALSLFTRQRCLTFWERLLLPFAYQQYFVGVRPRALARPGQPALANGQYFLIARQAYAVVGGHGAVAASITDDVALAGVLKRGGYPPLVRRGEALVRVRMYDSFGALAEGFTKNSFQFLREQRAGGALVVLSTACAVGVVPALTGALLSGARLGIAGALAALVLQITLLAPWERAFGVPLRYALLAPVAALTFTGIALSSALHALTRRPVRWKGRGYSATARAAVATASGRREEPLRVE